MNISYWLPMSPAEGPPLPAGLGIFWPWYKGTSATAKFKVGDKITYKVAATTNAIYQVTAVDTTTNTYTLASVSNGVVGIPVTGYSIATIDANYVLVS